jgi:hypothetical protein
VNVKEAAPLDSREADLLDLSIRTFSLLAVVAIHPFGSGEGGFWPNLVLGVLVSLVAGEAVWIAAPRYMPRSSIADETFDRRALAVGGAVGLVVLIAASRILSVPVPGQRVQWDGGMVRAALALSATVYSAGVVAIVVRGPLSKRSSRPGPDERPTWADLVDLLRGGRDAEGRVWLADQPDDAALTIAGALSRSSDVGVRLWIAASAGPRLGQASMPILERMAGVDSDERVRDVALDHLVDLAPEKASQFMPTIRRRLLSASDAEVEAAMWRLFDLRDPLLRDEMAAALEAHPGEDMRRSFEVLHWCVDGDRREIAARIDSQDRLRLPWLIKAAIRLDDDDIWNAVGRVASSGTDYRAKRHCSLALRQRYHSEEAVELE